MSLHLQLSGQVAAFVVLCVCTAMISRFGIGVSAATLIGSTAVSYVSASNACAAQSQRLCTVAELKAAAAAGLSANSAVWVLAHVGDTGAYSGTLSGSQFSRGGNREDFMAVSHLTACCPFGDIGVSNFFATSVLTQVGSCPAGYDASIDLNRGAGGSLVYMCVQYTRADSIASNGLMVADLSVAAGSTSSASCPSGYTKLSQDLNVGARGMFIYLCVLYSTTDTRTVVDAYVVDAGSGAACLSGYERNGQDLNAGARGDFLYLCYKRTSRQLQYLGDPSADVTKISQFSPGFHLSKRERFFPIGIPTLLASAGSAIYKNYGARSSDGAFVFPQGSVYEPSACTAAMQAAGDCTPIHSQTDFLNWMNVDQTYCFGYSASNVYEEHIDWEPASRGDSRVYYSIQRSPSGNHEHVLINYMLLYRWNGCVHDLYCQPSARLCSAGAIYPRVQHMGDLERVSVLVDRSFSRVLGVEVEKHGIAKGYPLLDYPGFTGLRGNSGPHVYVAAETHGMYPESSTNNPGPNGWTQECHACSGCPDCECYDPVWAAGEDQLVRVGKKTRFPNSADGGNWVEGEYWQRFPGRFGCGASIDSADKSGIRSVSSRWYVSDSSYPTTWLPPVNSQSDWYTPA